MGSFIAAIALFVAIAGIVASMRSSDESVDAFAAEPRRLPNPGSRDVHTVTGGTLGRAWVPSWG